jgi:hypothetical protein
VIYRQLTLRRPVRFAAPMLAATLALAACGGSGGSKGAADTASAAADSGVTPTPTGAALPAEPLFVGKPQIVADPGGASATLKVSTKSKVACKVVFGRDESVADGSATDNDMASGPHTTHKAVMKGLTPDTTYYYRVEGTDTDGKKYASTIATFKTAAAGSLKTPGKNVAPAATVKAVSSQFSDLYKGANAIDGDPATEWSSKGDGDKASITLDLGRVVKLVGVGFRTRSMSDGTAIIKSFTVTGDDGKTHGPYTLEAGLTVIDLKLSTRTLRFDAVKTTGGNTGAIEIEAYEAEKATPAKS